MHWKIKFIILRRHIWKRRPTTETLSKVFIRHNNTELSFLYCFPGFEHFDPSATLAANNPLNNNTNSKAFRKPKKSFKETDRLFSLSSVTSPVSIRGDLGEDVINQLYSNSINGTANNTNTHVASNTTTNTFNNGVNQNKK